MKKCFNTNGICYPDKHYMVSLDSRLGQIKSMIDKGDYFVINRARQYGKTTILRGLKEYLRKDYVSVLINFQNLSTADFQTEMSFVTAFADIFAEAFSNQKNEEKAVPAELSLLEKIAEDSGERTGLRRLFKILSRLCKNSDLPIVLMIDEVDSASNNQVFIDFLAQLRAYYLNREETDTFQSVILAGVYDIKNLKQKIHSGTESRYNSPWNIAADFELDMSFSAAEISEMLLEYKKDHKMDIDMQAAAQEIFNYTSGYPYLVSRICQRIDRDLAGCGQFEKAGSAWTKEGVREAVKWILQESNTLYDDMHKKLTENPELAEMLYRMLFYGQIFPYHEQNSVVSIGVIFGFLKNCHEQVQIANRIFEVWLYNLFLSEDAVHDKTYAAGQKDKNQFVKNEMLNMELILEKFMIHFTDLYHSSSDKFVEENGRRLFLLYLKPIINGTGNYYIEARTRNMGRTDVIVDYMGQQYVIEMKIWRGNEYNERGRQQLVRYLDDYHLEKGYLISFNFNKNKKIGMNKLEIGNKLLVEIVV